MTEYNTTNIAFAAFLLSKHAVLLRVDRTGRRLHWVFAISAAEAAQHEIRWLTSPEGAFFGLYQTLKKGMRHGLEK